jgi:dynein heavy chain
MGILKDYQTRQDKFAPDLNMLDIVNKIKDKTPYIVVALQECERMNILLGEIRKSL